MKKKEPIKYKKKAKNQRVHGDLAKSLIEIAVEFIEKNKTTAFTLRDLAHRLGVSHAAAYKHFDSKEDLLKKIALIGFDRLAQKFEAAKLQSNNHVEDIGKAYVEFGLENPGYYRVMFGIKFNKSEDPQFHESCFKSFYILLDAIGKRNSAHAMKALFAWSTVHGLVMLLLDGQTEEIMTEFNADFSSLESVLIKMSKQILT